MFKLVFFHYCQFDLLYKGINRVFSVSEDIYNEVSFFWSMNQNLEGPNVENGYLFRFTAKLNLTFSRNYKFQFFPNQLRRQLHFGKRILISSLRNSIGFSQICMRGFDWNSFQYGPCFNILIHPKNQKLLVMKSYLDLDSPSYRSVQACFPLWNSHWKTLVLCWRIRLLKS